MSSLADTVVDSRTVPKYVSESTSIASSQPSPPLSYILSVPTNASTEGLKVTVGSGVGANTSATTSYEYESAASPGPGAGAGPGAGPGPGEALATASAHASSNRGMAAGKNRIAER